MPALSATPLVNAVIARARSLPELIASLPPGLAQQLISKPLLASRSPPAVLLATGLAWVSTRYGLGWDDNTDALIAGTVLLGVAYLMRRLTKQPIAGVVSTPPGTPPAVEPILAVVMPSTK